MKELKNGWQQASISQTDFSPFRDIEQRRLAERIVLKRSQSFRSSEPLVAVLLKGRQWLGPYLSKTYPGNLMGSHGSMNRFAEGYYRLGCSHQMKPVSRFLWYGRFSITG